MSFALPCRTLLPVVPFALALAACGGGDGTSGAAGATRSDSAGVELVVHSVMAERAPVFATLDPSPILSLGSGDAVDEAQFGAVRDVVLLPDGGVAVLDGQAATVRIFDGDGTYRTSLGSKGEGPGEFQAPVELARIHGDTLAVFDPRPRRVTSFTPDGSLARITTLDDVQAQTTVAQILEDGTLLGRAHWQNPQGGGALPGSEPTMMRDTSMLVVFDRNGMVRDTVDVVPGAEDIVSMEKSERAISIMKRAPVFGRSNLFAATAEGFWSSTNDRFELRLRDWETGRLLRIVRASGLERPTTEATARAVRDRAMEEAENAARRTWLAAWYEASPRPETEPAYDVLLADERGRVWVRPWTPFGDAARWWVFTSGGDLLGAVDAPAGLRIMVATCDRVFGVVQDDFDVDHVVAYALLGVPPC